MNGYPVHPQYGPRIMRTGLTALVASTAILLAGCAAGTPAPESHLTAVTTTSPAAPTTEIPVPTTETPLQGWSEDALTHSLDPQIHQLADYGDVLQQKLPDSMMLFTSTPVNPEDAASAAADMATTLKQYHHVNIQPLVIMEPTTNGGDTILDLGAISRGEYNGALKVYFEALKAHGITDEMMGNWIPIPEANNNAWNVIDPQVVGQAIVQVAQIQKNAFPASHVGMLLDSQTYDPKHDNWSAKSLLPYVQQIPHGLVDNFCLQGFPYVDPHTTTREVADQDPNQFLGARMAIEAAKALGVTKVIVNSGTYSRTQVGSEDNGEVDVPVAVRQKLLNGETQQVRLIEQAGYATVFNYFAANKADTEGTDFSYQDPASTALLTSSVQALRNDGVGVSLFISPN